MSRNRILDIERIYFFVAVATDFLILGGSILLAVLVRFGTVTRFPPSTFIGTWAFFALGVFISSNVEHLYELRTTVNRTMHVFRMIRLVLVTSALYVILFFLLHFPRGIFLDSRIAVVLLMLFWAAAWIPVRTIILPHLFAAAMLAARHKPLNIMLIGPGKSIRRITDMLNNSPVYRRIFSIGECDIELPNDPEQIFDICSEKTEILNAEEFAIVFDEHEFPVIAEFSQKCYHHGALFAIYSPKVMDLRYFDPWLSLSDIGAVTFFGGNKEFSRKILVRLTDIIAALIALILLSPVLLFTAILVKLTSKGPVFFHQPRIGLNMKRFEFYKFRSMLLGSPVDMKVHKEYFRKYANGSAASDDGKIYKLDQSSRFTPIGRFMRKTSIDELPQLLNVLRGSMTLVGPRPCIEYELEHYSGWQLERFSVKPGLTGIWQVYGRSRLPFDTAQFLDFLYTIDRSYLLNLRLILKTFPVIFLGRGGI